MNDPGLDDAIADEANALDQYSSQAQPEDTSSAGGTDKKQRQLDSSPVAARWWLASTVYPLAAGTFGPMASAFNVCCLAQTWRMMPDDRDGYLNIADPKWVVAVNALSLVSALIANLFLSLNMARRVRFSLAQPIIVVGWFVSSALLIAIIIPFGVMMYKPENSKYLYTQAYFYGTFAAGMYFIIACLSTVTAYGAHAGHYSRDYKLSNSQRTLMLQTIIFVIYLLAGAAVYAKVEGWRFLDAVYWADYTLLTIGVGNFAPSTHLGRGLLFPYAVGGILVLGLIISSIRTLMLERGRQKMADVLAARTRKFLVKEATSDNNRLRSLVPDLPSDQQEVAGMSPRERRRREFITMRRVRQIATVQHKWISLIASFLVWMAMWLIGAVVFWQSEKYQAWTYFEALYFAYTTLLTIGYGDIYPRSSLGKAFFVFWSLLAVPTITILISSIGDTIVRFIRDLTLYIGEITILPGDEPLLERLKDIFRMSWTEKWVQETVGEKSDAQAILDDEKATNDPEQATSQVHHALETVEHKREESASARGDISSANLHHYHYLLFQEIQKLMQYTRDNMQKEFDYLEWEYYLALISGKHRPGADKDMSTSDDERQREFQQWSWLDKRNPIIGEKTEVQWLLHALTEALEKELRGASQGFHSDESEDRSLERRESGSCSTSKSG
ncbi:uncharacterized protein N7484_007504 [Penicillium longicatenatum]|uniref:uncharacterized protein n=1 Tax=Penicillium longicatenatum TaxID=1561947 RepID=UPI0025485071|nr:uncharacterized protein N7484_007504 [Penicillium longicatenatum]KAJ5639642.1 hypothetical protein N7484_007504 [Penicillium longicatenatum]